MGRLQEQYDFGDPNEMEMPELLAILGRMYTELAQSINQKPDLFERSDTAGPGSGDGQVSDTFLSNGTLNINSTTLKVEMLVAHPTTTTVTWQTLS